MTDALVYAKLCQAVYRPDGKVPPDCYAAGVRQLEWHDITETDTQFGVYRWGPFLLVVWRGTTNFRDWLNNLRLWSITGGELELEPMALPIGQGRIVARGHPGFWRCWRSSENAVRRALERHGHGLAIFSGHSLGGAVAAAGALAVGATGREQITLATFGAPRGLDRAGGLLLSLYTERLLRYVEPRDPVPMHPWRRWGYVHHAGEIRVGQWWWGYAPFWMRRYHAIERYIGSLGSR